MYGRCMCVYNLLLIFKIIKSSIKCIKFINKYKIHMYINKNDYMLMLYFEWILLLKIFLNEYNML